MPSRGLCLLFAMEQGFTLNLKFRICFNAKQLVRFKGSNLMGFIFKPGVRR
jgi:hypothetical protein